jgi:hypothetical protein
MSLADDTTAAESLTKPVVRPLLRSCCMPRRILPIVVLAAACGGSPADEASVRIIRGKADATYLDLTVVGRALDGLDGAPVEIQIGIPDRPPERLGIATTTVRDHAFEVRFPQVLEKFVYVKKVVWIDVNRDGACGAPDRVYVDYAAFGEDVTWDATASFIQGADLCNEREPSWPTE